MPDPAVPPDALSEPDPRITAAPAPRARRRKPRFAWSITGSGHFLEESLALARELPDVDLFLTAAGEEVLPLYKIRIEELRKHFRVFRDNSRSSVPVGMLYSEIYHTVVIAPATSNTVAKCVVGISDTLATNMFAQAGKLGIPGIVLACDTEPVVITRAPREWVELRPRALELDNVQKLRAIDFARVVTTPGELRAALERRLAELQPK